MNEIDIEVAYFLDCPKTTKKYWLYQCEHCTHHRCRIIGGIHGKILCDYNG